MSIKQIEADIADGLWKPPADKLRDRLEDHLKIDSRCQCCDWCKGFTAALDCVQQHLDATKGTE